MDSSLSFQRFEIKQKTYSALWITKQGQILQQYKHAHGALSGIPCKFKNKLNEPQWMHRWASVCVGKNDCKRKGAWVCEQAMVHINLMVVDGYNFIQVHVDIVLCGNCLNVLCICRMWNYYYPVRISFLFFIKGTYKVFLELFHLLLVALQSAVVHGSALDGDLPHLQVHLLKLEPIKKIIKKNFSRSFLTL